MSGFKIIKAGLLTSIQDYGRPDGGAFGMPWGGVMDRHSFELCNQILQNPLHTPVVEITQFGPTILFLSDVTITLTGADLSPAINNKEIELNKIYDLTQGDTLSFGKTKNGCRCYLGFSKMMDLALDQSSYSTYNYAKVGGLDGSILKKGDIIPFKERSQAVNYAKIHHTLTISSPLIVKVTKGPEYDLLSPLQQKQLLSTIFTVGKDSNRMGIRLNSETPVEGELKGIVSSGIVRGTVQLPPSGHPIILTAEAPTTGGYLRVFNCLDYSINQIAQLCVGDQLAFKATKKADKSAF